MRAGVRGKKEKFHRRLEGNWRVKKNYKREK